MNIDLYRQGQRIIATDGIMWLDGRLGLERAKGEVRKRNKMFEKNFPHKIADAFEYKGRIIKL